MSGKRPASSANLEALAIDCRHLLEQAGILKVIKVKKTGELDCMLEVTCHSVQDTITFDKVADEAEKVWVEKLAYGDFEAHTLSVAGSSVVLDFITSITPENVYLTGAISIDTQPNKSSRKE